MLFVQVGVSMFCRVAPARERLLKVQGASTRTTTAWRGPVGVTET